MANASKGKQICCNFEAIRIGLAAGSSGTSLASVIGPRGLSVGPQFFLSTLLSNQRMPSNMHFYLTDLELGLLLTVLAMI